MTDLSRPFPAFAAGAGPAMVEDALTGWAQLWGLWLEGAVQLGRFQSELARSGLESWTGLFIARGPLSDPGETGLEAVADELARTASAVGCPPTPLPE